MPAAIMAPARRAKQVLQPRRKADILLGYVFRNSGPFMKNDFQRVCRVDIGGKAVLDGFIACRVQFGLKSTEQFIPYYQKHAHIPVQVFSIGSMVNPVVGGRYKNGFQPAHFMNQFCMNKYAPDLGSGINKQYIQWPEAQYRQGNKIHEPV